MSEIRTSHSAFVSPTVDLSRRTILAVPMVLSACASGLVFGPLACLTALIVASLASFVIYIPLIAIGLNRGQGLAEDAPDPVLTRGAFGLLFALWTATAWLAAACVPALG